MLRHYKRASIFILWYHHVYNLSIIFRVCSIQTLQIILKACYNLTTKVTLPKHKLHLIQINPVFPLFSVKFCINRVTLCNLCL